MAGAPAHHSASSLALASQRKRDVSCRIVLVGFQSQGNLPHLWQRFGAPERRLPRSAALGSRLATGPFGPPPKASFTSFDVPDLASHFGCCSSRKIRVFGAVTG